jgi:hypothetical protein
MQKHRLEIKTPIELEEDLCMTTMAGGDIPSGIGVRPLRRRRT